MTYAHVEVEEIETTKSEKMLAVVLAIFLLIGGIWTYQKLDDFVAEALAPSTVTLAPPDRAAIGRVENAQRQLASAEQRLAAGRSDLVDAREAYNTALNAGEPARELRARYETAENRYASAQSARAEAAEAVAAARPAANRAQQELAQLQREASDRHELAAFVLRLVAILIALGAAYLLLGRARKRHSRFLPLALAAVASTALISLVMAGDYVTDYVDPLAVGPLLLSLAGSALTLLAFVGLQRYLARRVPIRRVRKGECPFCGYPVREGEHCSGCGRSVLAECATCQRPRRVGTAFCGSCGHA